jgi:hypothetical protein
MKERAIVVNCKRRGHKITGDGTECTSSYFGIQIPSEQKSLVSRFPFDFIIFERPTFAPPT